MTQAAIEEEQDASGVQSLGIEPAPEGPGKAPEGRTWKMLPSGWSGFNWPCQFARVALTKYHQLSGLFTEFTVCSFGGSKCKIKASAGLVLSGGCEAGYGPGPSPLLGLCQQSLVMAYRWITLIHLPWCSVFTSVFKFLLL